jgi:prolyl oligopeptidase
VRPSGTFCRCRKALTLYALPPAVGIVLFCALLLALPGGALLAQSGKPVAAGKLVYPETRRGDVVETLFGERVTDPYRWLENDVRKDSDVADWVRRQSAFTQAHLDKLPGRDVLAGRIRKLVDYERFGVPEKAGGRYFYMHNSGLQNQSVLYVRDSLEGEGRILIDPNAWASDNAVALDAWQPSDDGNLLAYAVQDGGSDWRTIRLLDVRTGTVLADELRWVKFSNIAWVGNEGVLYSRFPASGEGQDFQSRNYNQAVYFHRIGTLQDADELVFATPVHPEYGHSAQVTADGRLAVITSSIGTDPRYEVHVVDLARRATDGWRARPLVTGFTHDWTLVDGIGRTLYFVTNQDAPRCRLMRADLRDEAVGWEELVPQGSAKLERATIVGGRLILAYLRDASTQAIIAGLDGKPVRPIALQSIGTATGFDGKPDDAETFYAFSSFNQPASIYRLDVRSGRSTPFAEPKLTFRPDDFVVEQRFYTSKDGTRVPLFLVRRRDIAASGRAVPTLLYGYGGFDISLTPAYSPVRMAWLQSGGAFAVANLRGGGEYGSGWHDAGRLARKQNVFDDFIAAGEYLIAQGVTPKDGLAIQGGSNGGLLVGAVVNQRPDLFAAANPDVGVMDMLRFDRFTAGRYWVDDYGYPDREADFRVLRAYSPYHNIRTGQGGADYPAILVTTADTDDRVVPGHSFKYAAALQATELGGKPRLIRIETRAGHGSGKPTDKVIAAGADVLAFLAHWTGLEIEGDASSAMPPR